MPLLVQSLNKKSQTRTDFSLKSVDPIASIFNHADVQFITRICSALFPTYEQKFVMSTHNNVLLIYVKKANVRYLRLSYQPDARLWDLKDYNMKCLIGAGRDCNVFADLLTGLDTRKCHLALNNFNQLIKLCGIDAGIDVNQSILGSSLNPHAKVRRIYNSGTWTKTIRNDIASHKLMTRKVGDIDGELSATVLNSFSMFKNARKSLTGPLSQYIIAPRYSGSLESLLHSRANIDLELVVVSVLNALVILDKMGLKHRDIHWGNILVANKCGQQKVVLSDYGMVEESDRDNKNCWADFECFNVNVFDNMKAFDHEGKLQSYNTLMHYIISSIRGRRVLDPSARIEYFCRAAIIYVLNTADDQTALLRLQTVLELINGLANVSRDVANAALERFFLEASRLQTLSILEFLHQYSSAGFVRFLCNKETIAFLQGRENEQWLENKADLLAEVCVNHICNNRSAITEITQALHAFKGLDEEAHFYTFQKILQLLQRERSISEEDERQIVSCATSERERIGCMNRYYAHGITHVYQDFSHGVYCAKQLLTNPDLQAGKSAFSILNFIYCSIPKSDDRGVRENLFITLIHQISEIDDPICKGWFQDVLLFTVSKFSPIRDAKTLHLLNGLFAHPGAEVAIIQFLCKDISRKDRRLTWVHEKLDALKPIFERDKMLAKKTLQAIKDDSAIYRHTKMDFDCSEIVLLGITLAQKVSEILSSTCPEVIDLQQEITDAFPKAGIFTLEI